MNLKNQKRGGFYFQDELAFIATTKAIGDVLRKPGLEYWMKNQVFWAMVKNPNLEEAEALAAPYRESKEARDRGSTIHSIIEAWKTSRAYIQTVPEQFRGYAEAFYQFLKDQNLKILEQEKTIFSRKYGFAGTCDLLLQSVKNGRIFLVDAKTGKAIYSDAFLQLSAYKQALLESGVKVDAIGVLLLKEDGGYGFEIGEDCLDVFLAVLKIWKWQNREILEKLKPEEQTSVEQVAMKDISKEGGEI